MMLPYFAYGRRVGARRCRTGVGRAGWLTGSVARIEWLVFPITCSSIGTVIFAFTQRNKVHI